MILYLEAGHNKYNPGSAVLDKGVAVKKNGVWVNEADEALEFTLTLKRVLETEYPNVEVHLARSGDDTPSLPARIRDANAIGVDRFVSLHFDIALWGWRWGCYHSRHPASKPLADRVSRALDGLNGAIGTWVRATLLSRFKRLYIDDFTRGPAILIELGPIRDMNRDERLKYARAIAKELVK
jgi:N-acetylmuramoyl-L-alanine amidase